MGRGSKLPRHPPTSLKKCHPRGDDTKTCTHIISLTYKISLFLFPGRHEFNRRQKGAIKRTKYWTKTNHGGHAFQGSTTGGYAARMVFHPMLGKHGVYPIKYTHSLVVLCNLILVKLRFYFGSLWFIAISFRVASLALGQSYDCPSASEATLKDMGKIRQYHTAIKRNKVQNCVHIIWRILYIVTTGNILFFFQENILTSGNAQEHFSYDKLFWWISVRL